MSISWIASDDIKNLAFSFKPSKGLKRYFYVLLALTLFSFGLVALVYVLMWLFLPFLCYYFYLCYQKHIQLDHPKSIVALQYKQSQHWVVYYKGYPQVFAEQAAKLYATPWFFVLPLRVVTSKKLFCVFVPKDSIPQEKFQLSLYQLT